ncbi:glycosyltransferase [Spirosoma sp. KUDC1026]|uniref:glycosyltransferase n=1 Tax=Spirosoma sp. KUDC1026 TaxID=2745947 RepID=UPI00159B8A9D|nr:glycosyltransferase [Spirosoma sp. KUDC1026]QKZ12676.1 glycosyltransferase [Spirosoma sp. KUDC1026]
MKIMISADWFYPAQKGGPSNSIYWQSKALTRAGYQVTVVATSQDQPTSTPLNRWVTLDCGRVIYTRNPHFYLPLRHLWYGWRTIRQVDVVHVNSLFYPSSLVFVWLAKLVRKRIVWTPHGELSPVALRFSPWRKRVVLSLIRRVCQGVTFHATSAEEVAQIRQQLGPTVTVRAVTNMMELPEPVGAIDVSHKIHPYLLFIGRLHPIKAIDRLIDAVAQSELFWASDYQLIIAGQDINGYRQRLIEQVQQRGLMDRVLFIGEVEGARKEMLYARAQVTILPSHSENFGNVVMESLAQGTPVIASTGTPWQLLETEQVGNWVVNDPETLGKTIDTYLTMPDDQYRAYRNRAHALAHQRFDIMANVAQWQTLYTGQAV